MCVSDDEFEAAWDETVEFDDIKHDDIDEGAEVLVLSVMYILSSITIYGRVHYLLYHLRTVPVRTYTAALTCHTRS